MTRRIYRRVVIESPFGAPTKEGQDENLRYLRACMRDCLERGEAPFASHGLYTQDGVLNDWDPNEREKGIQAGFEWRAVSQATIVYVDRGITPGMRAGIRKATDLMSAGVFDHYVEYRFLGGEWSSLGGPEEIRKHLEGLLDEHQTKHRHLALVSHPDDDKKHVRSLPTPGELSLEGVPRKADDGTIVTTVEEEALHAKPFLRSEKPNGPRMESYAAAVESLKKTPITEMIPPWTVDERAAWKEREHAKQFQQQPPPLEEDATVGAGVPSRSYTREVATKLSVTSKKGKPCPHGTYYSLCKVPECVALVKDLLRPEAMSENTKAMVGHGAQTDDYGMEFQDPPDPTDPPGPRGRMADGLVPPKRDPDKDSW